MGAYIFAIIGMLIVITILYFLPLGFSTGGTFLIAGIAFTAALLFILLQNVLDLWTALLAGIGIIFISAIVLQKKGETFVLESADHGDEDQQELPDHTYPEEENNQSVQEETEEQDDLIIHNSEWRQEEPDEDQVADPNEEHGQDEASTDELDPEESEISEDKEDSEMAEMLESRNHVMLSATAVPDSSDEEKEPESSETDEVLETDRSWLESAAVYDTAAETSEEVKEEPKNESLDEPLLNQDEQIFFTNLQLEDDEPDQLADSNDSSEQPQADEPENSEQLLQTDEEIQEHQEQFAPVISGIEEEPEQRESMENTDHAELPLVIEDQDDGTEKQLSEEDEINHPESKEENHAHEETGEHVIIDEQIFNLITSEFDSYNGSDIEGLEREVRETLKLTTDSSQQFALYRILLEQMINLQLISEALTLSNEVSETFENEFINIEMNELRNLLS